MRNEKGITLIEALGAAVILAMAVLAITYMLQQSTIFSSSNNRTEQSVMIARTAMEEIKDKLGTDSSVAIFGQTVDLEALRQIGSATIYSPDGADQKYRIDIQTFHADSTAIDLEDQTYTVDEFFRLVRVTCTDLASGKDYRLEAYAAYT